MKVWISGSFLLLATLLGGCNKDADETAISMVGGNPDHGRKIIVTYGCIACHTIPGVNGANALVGPPLTRMAARTYVGGVLQNTPANMIQWIQNPPGVDPKTAMPNLHVTQGDARDITTYLYTLQ
jgi:cytochrome c2